MKRMLFVLNPCAGQRKAKKALADIIEVFNCAGFTVITHITSGSGDAEAACLRYAEYVDLIVCCGGDGTFNETVSGVLKSGRDVPIGYIPAGTTNDFASSLRLSTDFLQAARDIVELPPKPLDIGMFGDRYFSYIASFGAFTRSSYATPQSVKQLLGHAAYVLSGIQELSQLRTHTLRFVLPDGTCVEDRYIFGAISNSTRVGGVLTLSPERVDMTDGKVELLLIRAPKDLFELADCVRALQQQTYNCGMITFLNTDSVKITAPENMPWTIDGEQEDGQEQIQVSCLHHAIRIICK